MRNVILGGIAALALAGCAEVESHTAYVADKEWTRNPDKGGTYGVTYTVITDKEDAMKFHNGDITLEEAHTDRYLHMWEGLPTDIINETIYQLNIQYDVNTHGPRLGDYATFHMSEEYGNFFDAVEFEYCPQREVDEYGDAYCIADLISTEYVPCDLEECVEQ